MKGYKMEKIRLNPECISCLMKKHLEAYPKETSRLDKIQYMQSILKIISDADKEMSAPELLSQINEVKRDMFGKAEDFTEIKKHFNSMMMSFENDIMSKINSANDPLKMGLCYAMTGNYIDFGALDSVGEDKLRELIENVNENMIGDKEYDDFKSEIEKSKRVVYLTDNCGEIVFDKVFISVIKNMFPDVSITAIVRGYDVLNDATMADAKEIGLDRVVEVIDNGTDIAGTCLDKISEKASEIIDSADLIISKGQGNFETLQMCGKNIYYVFLCKCQMFADRFNVPLYSGMLIKENKDI